MHEFWHGFLHGFWHEGCMDLSVMVSPRFYSVVWMTEKFMHTLAVFCVLFFVLVGFFHAPNWCCGGIFRAPHFPIPGGGAQLMPRGATPEFGRCAAPWHETSLLATRRAAQTQSARRRRRAHSPRTASSPQRGHPAQR